MEKTCISCGVTQPEEEFYKRCSRCKPCRRLQVKERARSNPSVQAYDRKRALLPHRKESARFYATRFRRENPEKYRAETIVNNAIRDGRLPKGERCEIDGCNRMPLHAHHDDYSQPLKVRWLCVTHHRRYHAETGQP